jgi:hypothetical protein
MQLLMLISDETAVLAQYIRMLLFRSVSPFVTRPVNRARGSTSRTYTSWSPLEKHALMYRVGCVGNSFAQALNNSLSLASVDKETTCS